MGDNPAADHILPKTGRVNNITTHSEKSETHDIVVGIGASAGGQEALERFFTAMPAGCGLAFVVVMHLPPDEPPFLARMLAPHTPMAVLTAEDGMPCRPNTVYVIPAGKELTLHDGQFQLQAPTGPGGTPHPVDRFFHSLALDKKEHSVAVVLSGAGTDGAAGAIAVSDAGGIVLVQQPDSAANPSMPLNTLASGAVDLVLPAEDIAGKIAAIANGSPLRTSSTDTLEEDLAAIFAIVKARTGHDFSSYKRNTVMRRIERRMAVHDIAGIKKYLALLEADEKEARALWQEILIGVTSFFRDPEAFETLSRDVLPRLFSGRNPEEPVRIWHACCATGEEVYSTAILIREFLNHHQMDLKVQIFATDIDEGAIAQARSGLYGDEIRTGLSEERLKTFFTRIDGHLQVAKTLREMVVFAHHNLIKDPPFSRLDLLVCRNFLIYLNPDMQKRLFSIFHQALKPRGILFLGTAETAGQHSELFAPINKKWKLYERLDGSHDQSLSSPLAAQVYRLPQSGIPSQSALPGEPKPGQLAEKRIVERYAPPCVLVNENYQVVHVSTKADKFLNVPVGEPTRDLLRMVREELRPALRAAIYKTFTEQKQVVFRGVKVVFGESQELVDVLSEPLNAPPPSEKLALVILESAATPLSDSAPNRGEQPLNDDETSRETLVHQLEEQLRITQEQLQALTEQLQSSQEGFVSANEELISINEEYQSANEELQSTNEELETSKEELQVLNEELSTVNNELLEKVEELDQANSDMENLLTSSEVATIFLDRQLTIRRFSPAMAEIFNLIAADIGRPFRHLAGTIDWTALPEDAHMVLSTLTPVEREVSMIEGKHHFLMRVLPYRTSKGTVDGVVVTLFDITERKQMEEQTRHLASFPEMNPNPVMELDTAGGIVYANPVIGKILESTGRIASESEDFLPSDLAAVLADWDRKREAMLPREISIGERVFSLTLHLIPQFGTARIYGYDSTLRKRAEEEREATVEFLRLVNESRKLGDMVRGATTFLQKISGCEAVGIRLREGADFPYFETRGFSREFVLAENYLCTGDPNHSDGTGNPVLECMCGNVLCGRFNPEKPFFTEKGNFWTNSTTELLNSTSEEDRQARTRNRCHGEGYESVALITLSLGDEALGLLQLNDPRRDRFSPELIALYERLAGYLAVAVAKFRVEEQLRESEERERARADELNEILNIAPMPIWIARDPQCTVVTGNQAAAELLAVSTDRNVSQSVSTGESVPLVRHYLDGREMATEDLPLQYAVAHGEGVHDIELDMALPDGNVRSMVGGAAPLFDNNGQVRGGIAAYIDITERKRIEEALQESEERLRLFIEHAPVSLAMFDEDMRYLSVSRRWRNDHGLDDRPLIGESHYNVFPGISPERKDAHHRGLNGEVLRAEADLILRPDGTQMWVRWEIRPWRHAGGSIGGIIIFTEDITERKLAEESLRRSEEEFRAMFTHSSVAKGQTDPVTGRFLRVNAALCRLTGYAEQEMLKRTFVDVTHPDDRQALIAKRDSLMRGEVPNTEVEHRYLRPDGSIVWVYVTINLIRDEAGHPLHTMAVIQDITERKRNAERQEILAETARRLLASDSPQDVVDTLCQKVMAFLDCQAFFNFLVDESAGRLHLNACAGIPEAEAEKIEWLDYGMAVCGCAARDACRVVAEDIPNTPDPRTELVKSFGIRAYACHPLIAQGQTLGTLSFGTRTRCRFSDDDLALMKAVADQVAIAMVRKKTEEELRRAKEAAEAATRVKGQFLANMSHELRTPMTGVLGMLDLVLLDELPDEQRGYLETVQESAHSLLRILNDILDFSRIEAGIVTFEEEPFSLRDSVRGTLALFDIEARRKGLKLTCEIASDTPQQVLGDEGRVRQILVNLIGNAIKFTAQGEVAVRVEPGTETSDGYRGITFTVADTGIGIQGDKQDVIFQPFSQADSSLTRRFGGTGLGLTISKDVAEKMGGAVTVTSKEGKGSTFVVTLPLKETNTAAPVAGSEDIEEGSAPAAVIGTSPRLLAAEDDPTIRNYLKLVFRKYGFDLDLAVNGEEAVTMWSQGDYDLIIMDGQMPKMDGIVATRAIRAHEKTRGGHIPIVALTAHAFSTDREKYLDAGMDAYVAKPIKIQKLLDVVKELLGSKWHG